MVDQASGLLSPLLRKIRIKIVLPYIQGKVLDYGCGVGALSEMCKRYSYLGVDIDKESIYVARKTYPLFRFATDIIAIEKFDTIIALAVIEHASEPVDLLKKFKLMLKPEGRIVLTTPHPSVEWIHTIGSKIGLFSAHASNEHQQLIDYGYMEELSIKAGFVIEEYKRFMLGANQLFVLRSP